MSTKIHICSLVHGLTNKLMVLSHVSRNHISEDIDDQLYGLL